jgi:putative NADH-flavin reductase
MKIVVFGANGGVGRRLVELALGKNHTVTAAVRNPASLDIAHDRLSVVTCDVRSTTSVGKAIEGQDAVLCALGDRSRGPTDLYSAGARVIVEQMQAQGVRRIVFLSNFGILEERPQGWIQSLMLRLVRRVIPHTLADHRRALGEIRNRPLDWVIVRPMALNNGPWTGAYRVAIDDLPARGTRIARADVADFMLRQASASEYLQKLPSIAY